MAGHAARHWRSVQALRGVAALMVVAFHALEQAREARLSPGPAWPNGAAGVDLFFVISGVVMVAASARLAGQAHGWQVFLRRRAERVVPLYWLATAAKLALVLSAPSLARHARPGWANTACSFLFLPSANAAGEIRPVLPAGWTLSFEMLFYLVFAAGLALRLRGGLRGVVLRTVLPALLALSLLGLARGPDSPALAALADPLVLEFGAGALLGLWLLHPPPAPVRTPTATVGLLLLAVVAAVALAVLPAGTPWRRALGWGSAATLLVAALLALERRDAVRWPRPLLHLGDASYAIYLAHGFVLGGLAALHLPDAWTLLTAALASSMAAGLAVHHWVERPIAAWLARRRKAASKAGLSLRWPFQRPKRAIGTLGSYPSAGPSNGPSGPSEPLASYARTRKGSTDPLIPPLK